MKKSLAIVLFCICFGIQSVGAQQFQFNKYMVEQGLSHNSVRCILQDTYGFMWIGTSYGLNRFDGKEFRIFKNKNSSGSYAVYSLLETDPNTLLVGSNRGMYVFDKINEQFTPFDKRTKYGVAISTEVRKIVQGKNGLVWIATIGQGVFMYDPGTELLQQDSRHTSFVWDIDIDGSQRVYASSLQDGLICFDQNGTYIESFDSFISSQTQNDSKINCIRSVGDKVWFSVGKGLIGSLDTYGAKTTLISTAPNNVGTIRSIEPYSQDVLMLGSDNGIYLLNIESNKISRIDSEGIGAELSDQSVSTIYKDIEGGLWVGTSLGGLNYLSKQPNIFENHTLASNQGGGNAKVVSVFCEDAQRNVWIGSQNGLWLYNSDSNTTSEYPIAGKSYDIRSLLIDGDNLWVGTFGDGIKIINLKTKALTEHRHSRDIKQSIPSNDVLSLCATQKGVIYVGTSWGLCKYNREADNFVAINQIGAMISIEDLMVDRYKNLWIATSYSGLFRFETDSGWWFNYTYREGKAESINSNSIVSLYELSDGQVLACTDGDGVSVFNKEKNTFSDFDPQQKILGNKVIYDIAQDNQGYIWFSSNEGIIRFNTKSGESRIFSQESGLQNNMFIARSSMKSKSGKLFFGKINGYNSFYPDKISENSYTPPVFIVGVDAYKKGDSGVVTQLDTHTSMFVTKQIKLPSNVNKITLQFAALSYESPGLNQYRYRLVGYQNQWTASNLNTATYENLPSGRYVFEVLGSNNDGLWNKTEATLTIVVMPVWWRSGFAYLVYLFVAMGLIYSWVRYSYRRTNAKIKREIESINDRKENEIYQSKINFFVNLVHEIRTPLSLIKLPLDKVVEMAREDKQISAYLSVIHRNIDYLLSIVNQLLDFQKVDNNQHSLALSSVDVRELVEQVFDQFDSHAKLQHKKLTINLPQQEVVAMLDRGAVTKILFNLLNNAIKFASHSVELRVKIAQNSLTISVSDDGVGVADEEKEKIFGAFYQTDSQNQSGTGIGLAFARLLTQNHGGTIVVLDNEGGGAQFVVTIPIVIQTADYKEPINQTIDDLNEEVIEPTASPFQSCRILLVEDNTELLGVMYDLLRRHFTVVKSINANDALGKLARETFDVIVSDVMMPGMDGFEFCRVVKSDINTSHIPVILLTAKVSTESKIEGMEHGADVYIEKPFSIKYLRKQIENLLKLRLAFQKLVPYVALETRTEGVLSNRDMDFLTKLNEEINLHIAESDYSIDSLAETMFMSRSNFYRKIKSVTGAAPNDYLKVFRLNKAAELLKSKGVRIGDVYIQVGFSSSSYFAKCFKIQFGVLPKEYLEAND